MKNYIISFPSYLADKNETVSASNLKEAKAIAQSLKHRFGYKGQTEVRLKKLS